MKFNYLFSFLPVAALLSWTNNTRSSLQPASPASTFHDFKMPALDGSGLVDFSIYKGKKVVVLNVASECGYTPQYADWEAFYKEYGDRVIVLGFPANDFGGQEPGTSEQIAGFCQKNYGVTFPMFEKIAVTGAQQHPLYQWLSKKDLNGSNDQAPTWNFCKYVVDENGKLTQFFDSKVLPDNADFRKAVGI